MRKLLYIMGTANCGSTLLTRVLANHPGIATIGELKATAIEDIEQYQCACGREILECGFWKEVSRRCAKHGFPFDLRDFQTAFNDSTGVSGKALKATVRGKLLESIRAFALNYYPPAKSAYERTVSNNARLMDAICETMNKPIFLDGSKDPTRALHFFNSGKFDVKIIHLVRDGRAVVASYKKRDKNHTNNIALWKQKTLECERAKRLLPVNAVLTLKYEEFCSNPDTALKRICTFVETTPLGGELADMQLEQHIIGHGSRLLSIGKIAERVEWPNLLTENELQFFNERGASLNHAAGYN